MPKVKTHWFFNPKKGLLISQSGPPRLAPYRWWSWSQRINFPIPTCLQLLPRHRSHWSDQTCSEIEWHVALFRGRCHIIREANWCHPIVPTINQDQVLCHLQCSHSIAGIHHLDNEVHNQGHHSCPQHVLNLNIAHPHPHPCWPLGRQCQGGGTTCHPGWKQPRQNPSLNLRWRIQWLHLDWWGGSGGSTCQHSDNQQFKRAGYHVGACCARYPQATVESGQRRLQWPWFHPVCNKLYQNPCFVVKILWFSRFELIPAPKTWPAGAIFQIQPFS